MALNKERLKQKIKAAFKREQTEEVDFETSVDRVSEAIALAIVDEIKQLTITYNSGLTAPNGPVGGTFNNTLT